MEFRAMQAAEADLELLGELFDANGSPKDRSMLRWRYLENPTGTVIVDFALHADEGRLAGAYCVSPTRFRVGPSVVLGVQSIDTMVDASARGHGLFGKLASRTYARCGDAGVELVYGFPNGSSAPGFFGRLGWTRLDPVPFLVRVIRPGFIARRVLGRRVEREWLGRVRLPLGSIAMERTAEVRVVDRVDERFTRVWSEFAGDQVVGVERDEKYLSWRLRAPFPGGYSVHALLRRGDLKGYAVSRMAEKHGGRIGYVMELLHDAQSGRDAVGLLRYSLRELAENGAEVVLAWCLPHSPNYRTYRSCGFVPLPLAVRPIELHFGARTFVHRSACATGNRKNWYLSYFDSDTV